MDMLKKIIPALFITIIGFLSACDDLVTNKISPINFLDIEETAPAGLTYTTTYAIYTAGVTISPNVPTVTGTVTLWSVSSALPSGLNLNAATGVISGTPSTAQTLASYTITATNSGGSTTATISITINPASSTKSITSFAFTAAYNASLPFDVTGYIDNGAYTIELRVPSGTSVTSLIATFATDGVSVHAGGISQVSGSTINDFSSPVVYIVTAADTTTRNYSVNVIVSPNSQTFSMTGSEQQFTVPAGVHVLLVDVIGAQGAGYNNTNGSPSNGSYPPYGLGTRVQAIIPVTPGETLYIYVGGSATGYNGGGVGSTSGAHRSSSYISTLYCGNGGGASDIRQGGYALTNRIIVAGGGGGAGDGINGIGGGLLWIDGYYGNLSMTLTAGTYYAAGGNASGPGDPGTQSSGGGGGLGAYGGTNGGDGSLGQGGDGGIAQSTGTPYQAQGNGGGGGGGYYGGGGGGSGIDGAGGGGGSNLVPNGGTETCGYPQIYDGKITISW